MFAVNNSFYFLSMIFVYRRALILSLARQLLTVFASL